MKLALIPYDGPVKDVVVYNTYADGRRLHFDVFIPTPDLDVTKVPSSLDAEALGHAKTFLALIGHSTSEVQVSMCARCHIDNTGRYVGRLWKLPGTEATIWPLEGCPQPAPSIASGRKALATASTATGAPSEPPKADVTATAAMPAPNVSQPPKKDRGF